MWTDDGDGSSGSGRHSDTNGTGVADDELDQRTRRFRLFAVETLLRTGGKRKSPCRKNKTKTKRMSDTCGVVSALCAVRPPERCGQCRRRGVRDCLFDPSELKRPVFLSICYTSTATVGHERFEGLRVVVTLCNTCTARTREKDIRWHHTRSCWG